VLRWGIRNGILPLVETGLGSGAETDKTKENEEIHDTPLQQFHLMKKIFFSAAAGNPLRKAAGAAMHGKHAMEPPLDKDKAEHSGAR
jgi:hypothetical protein